PRQRGRGIRRQRPSRCAARGDLGSAPLGARSEQTQIFLGGFAAGQARARRQACLDWMLAAAGERTTRCAGTRERQAIVDGRVDDAANHAGSAPIRLFRASFWPSCHWAPSLAAGRGPFKATLPDFRRGRDWDRREIVAFRFELRASLGRAYRRIRGSDLTPLRFALSLAVGLWVGCLPLYGVHFFLCALLTLPLRLNFLVAYAAAHISIPPTVPFLWFAALQ